MGDGTSSGYTKEEYFSISAKHGLPPRCPILRRCCRAVLTKYKIGHEFGGSDMSFEEFLHSQHQSWEPDKMIKEMTIPSCQANDLLTSAVNVCPEVSLFEHDYMPRYFRQLAFGNASYYKESRRFEAEAKHYSECAEFSEYIFQASEGKMKGFGTRKLFDQIPEKNLEDYLTSNIEALEPGLKFIERQKTIGNWKVDIFASDLSGADVLIELKSKTLNRNEIDMLSGQVSRYFNRVKPKSINTRMIAVIPKDKRDKLDILYHGLKHWIEKKQVCIIQFDYAVYDKKYIFRKVVF